MLEDIYHIFCFKISDSKVTDRPLTLLYSWMLAKDKHMMKYSKFYTDRGINVLKVRISPFDLLRPVKGSQVLAEQVLKFLHSNPSISPLLVHGFSVGAYTFCESMAKVEADRETHGPLLKRFVGQIWDSAVDIYGIPEGLPRAITTNKVLQKSMKKYLTWYMKSNYETATRHYERSSQMMHANIPSTPGLFIFSKSDPVSYPAMNLAVVNSWEQKGHTAFTKCFESSPHVAHFTKHKKEYEEEVTAFLERVDMLEPVKGRAVLS
ncbi:UNVERIFIED_CONTAM: hypothetical protein GTU68_044616 [Idotea baltica]|nr:hypothetical protein [Idotea baltica]